MYFRQQYLIQWRNALLKQPGTPHEMGLAFAIGTFISILPTPGFNFVLASFLLTKWRHLHRAAMFLSLAVWNTLVVAPLYTISMKLGNWFFGTSFTDSVTLSFIETPLLLIQGFLVGNVVTALGTAVICYALVNTVMTLLNKNSLPQKVS